MIIDDLLSEDQYKKLIDFITSLDFPWYYQPNIAYIHDPNQNLNKDIIQSFGLTHTVWDIEKGKVSEALSYVECRDQDSTLLWREHWDYYPDHLLRKIIREDAKEKIEIVIALMEKYPSLKIKLKAHTDSQGPDAYNLALSERRAQATVDYMLTHSDKITTDRLEAQGYGETDLANKACPNNVRCSDKEHEKNRRTEFIICGE